jgi:exosortase/archaeosortase family protein
MGKARTTNSDGTAKAIATFACIFLGCTIVFHLIFDHYQDLVGMVYVRSISLAAALILHGIGIDAEVITDLRMGACTLKLDTVSYLITQGCTGLFTSALYVSGVISIPVAAEKKLTGLLIGIPAFFVFGTVRVVIMAIVAVVQPARVEVFHVYIMAIANLGFAMFVWLYWVNRVIDREYLGKVPG